MLTLRFYISRQTLVSTRNILRSIHNFFSTMIFEPESSSSSPPPPQNDPPPFDPSQPSIPISYPLKTLEELENRSYFDSFHYPFNKSSVPLRSDSISMPNRGRVLVCHDMAGGYTEGDRWVQGGGDSEAYAIWHWYLMDVFVYFSHSLVTIPPPCWTNAAHTHGVKVLGTFITEWDEGKVICNKMLSTKESARMYAELLAELAVALGFDGWLINMEVSLDVGQIPTMKEFVSHLTQTLHSSMPGSLIIWYDSVTIKGDLSWQDQLNDLNKPFFDICDGIFVNYTWKEDYPKRSADVAGDRKYDVYMGIDVFGRSTYGGGQWNTNVALDVIKKNDVSAAIFAPGWVYETKQPPDFQTAQNRWWELIEQSWGVLQRYPKCVPFYSNFDQGRGYHFSVDGSKVSAAPWCNISCQSFQPFLEFSEDHTPDTIQVHVDFKEASYSGGGNITFKGSIEHDKYFTTRLFQGELLLVDSPLHFTYSVKSDGSSLIGLSVEFLSSTSERKSVFLAAHGRTLLTMNRFSSKFSNVIMPDKVTLPETPSGWVIQESSIAMSGYTLIEINAVCYKFEPEFSWSKLNYGSDSHQVHVLARDPKEYFAVLGDISIKSKEPNEEFPPSNSWILDGQYIKWTSGSEGSRTLSVKLIWKLKNSINSYYPKYNIYVEKGVVLEYLGEAQVEAFYVSDLVVPSDTSCVKFRIQICGVDGTCQKLDVSPLFQLDVEDSHNNSRLMKTPGFSLTKVTTNWTLIFNSFSLLVLTFSLIFFVLSFVAICLSFSSVM